jgi:hypothetical protein
VLPEPQVPDDLLAPGGILDDRDQSHPTAAPSAHQNIFPPHPAEKVGSSETARASRVVRAAEVGAGRVVVLVLVRINRRCSTAS